MGVTFLCLLILQTAIVTAVTLALTSQLARRNHLILGVVLALAVIFLVELLLQWTVTAGVQDCLRRACLSAGQPPNCQIAEFGCSEWSGVSRLIYWAAGALDLVAYLIGGIVLVIRAYRKKSRPSENSSV
jgi:hypothetical protein